MNEPAVNLICLPFAGGSAYSYAGLRKAVAPFIDVLPVELPGRGRRFADPLLTDVHGMVSDVLRQMRDAVTSRPYALFGHSLGAKVAYEVVRRIARERLPAPEHLFVSGAAAPSIPPRDRGRHLLPRPAFLEMIAELGGTPQEVLGDAGLMELFEPVLRADFQANGTYEYRKGEPLKLPITVFIGSQDKVSRHDALKWEEETYAKMELFQMPGGHFFLFDQWDGIGRIVSRTLGYLAVYAARLG